jgi:hypothetical protein
MASLRFNKRIASGTAIDRAPEAGAVVLRAAPWTRPAYHELDLQPRSARGCGASEGLAKDVANHVLLATCIARRA